MSALNARSGRGLLARPEWFPAMYPGTCNVCGRDYEVGTPITWAPRATTDEIPMRWKAGCCERAQ